MTPTIWANVLLAMPFLLGWIAVPVWMTLKRPPATPDFSEAHAYLAAKQQQAPLGAGQPQGAAEALEPLVAA